MTVVRWDPFRGVSALQERINRLFDESFSQTKTLDDDVTLCAWEPAVDVYETGGAIVFKAELPGVQKEDVSVEIKDNVLTLKGERFVDPEIDEEKYYRKERCFGTFHRSFTLRSVVRPDQIKAKFTDGILEVEVPKPEEEKLKHISVNIE